MNELIDWVANQGFAIAVAVYLLVRLETKIDKLIDLVEQVISK